jgi:hypothetical protein
MRTYPMALGLLIAFLLLVSVHGSFAGSGYDLHCADDKCGFSTAVKIGGGFSFEQAGGFCKKCNKWVAVTWKRSEKAPAQLLEFWNPRTGEVNQICKCPVCGRPYLVIKDIEDMKFCPKCNKPSLRSKLTIMYD